MANLLLTEKCVRSCPYCFAKEYLKESREHLLSWENLIYVTDLFESSHEKHLSLLGGEPTLHPDFIDFVCYLHQRKFQVNVFTSGIMSDKTLQEAQKHLLKIPSENLSFVCNYNHPSSSTAKETQQINRFLTCFSKYITLSFNLYQQDFDFGFLVETILKYDLKKHIRLGLAQPIPGQKNECLKVGDLHGMAARFREQLTLLEKQRISIGFDCGMPLCIFSDEDLGRLFKLNRGKVQFSCGAAIDIGPDMQVWACFPLSNHEKKLLYDFNNVEEIKQHFAVQSNKIRKKERGIFTGCKECIHLEEKLCMGGCLAHLVEAEEQKSRRAEKQKGERRKEKGNSLSPDFQRCPE